MSKEKRYKCLSIAMSAFSAVCVIVIAVMLIMWPRDTQHDPAGSTVDNGDDVVLTADNAIAIETPYGTIFYPKTWASYVKYTGEAVGEAYAESFYCCLKEQEIPLFTIHFNATDKGFEAGTVSRDGCAIPVAVELHEYIPDDTWSEEETTVLYAMQESVNEVLTALLPER